jgi:hypothetical protein
VVGRSLRRLQREGLVAREGTGWCLTAAGADHARGARARLERTFEDAASHASSALSDLTRAGVLADTGAALRGPATDPGDANRSGTSSGGRPTPATDGRGVDLGCRALKWLSGPDLGAWVMPRAARWLAWPLRARCVGAAFGRADLVPGPSMDVGLVRGVVEAHEAGATRGEICGKVMDHYDEGDAAALAWIVERLCSNLGTGWRTCDKREAHAWTPCAASCSWTLWSPSPTLWTSSTALPDPPRLSGLRASKPAPPPGGRAGRRGADPRRGTPGGAERARSRPGHRSTRAPAPPACCRRGEAGAPKREPIGEGPYRTRTCENPPTFVSLAITRARRGFRGAPVSAR